MPTYKLCFEGDEKGGKSHVFFEARDPGAALMLTHAKKPTRGAVLWQGDKRLCRLERRLIGDYSEIWVVAP